MSTPGERAVEVSLRMIRGVLHAVPPVVRLRSGDAVIFDYAGHGRPRLFVPDVGAFDTELFDAVEQEDGWRIVAHVRPDAPSVSVPYAFWAPDQRQLAEGNSPPRMNINDPEKDDD